MTRPKRLRALFTASLCSASLLIVSFPSSAEEVKERSEIPAQYKWDLSAMYANTAEWKADIEKLKAEMPGIDQYRGRMAETGQVLLAAIQAQEELNRRMGNIWVYAGMKSYEDLRNSENGAHFAEASSLRASLAESLAFFSPELLAIPEAQLRRMVDDTPGLHPYRHYLDEELRLKSYTLSENEEKLLAMAGDPMGKFQRVFGALDNADLSFGEMKDEEGTTVELTKARYGAFLSSTDRDVRRDAWMGLFEQYEKMGNTLAANYDGHVKSRVFFAKARGYDSALQRATFGSAIPTEVYTSLITTAREGAPPLQRYLALRQEALGVEQLEVWDLYAPIVDSVYDDISWEDGKKIVADALSVFGQEYLDLYWFGFEDGWVDAFESRGKRGGAYSWGTYDSKPYLSMNYQGNLSDVSTLAHEYGHSLHSWMSRHTQPYAYGYYRTFIAEVASMTNQAILIRKMLAEAETPAQKVYLLQHYLDNFRGSFFRQASFADFEMQAHARVEAGESLSKESLNALYAEVFEAYYGDAVSTHSLNDSEWSRIPHFMRTDNFYVYQYATSFVAATALSKQILEEGEPARERFLALLRAGSSDYPIALLREAGVDMTTAQPVRDTLAVFDEMVAELERNLAAM